MNKVLITGAASGLGKALALEYAKAGANICVADLNEEQGEEVVQLIKDAGGDGFFQRCDITSQADVDSLISTVEGSWQSLDILINNAGIASAGLHQFEDMDSWQWVMDINLLGHVRMTKAFVPLIKKSDSTHAAVINIASQAGITPTATMGSYCASKAAVVSFSEVLYYELAHTGIHVSVVCPAFFDTNLNKSLRTNQQGMDKMVNKLVKGSGVQASEIAAKVVKQSKAKDFMIVTHRSGRIAYLLKRLLPTNIYVNMVRKKTAKFIKAND